MSGLNPQSRRKSEKRAVDMSAVDEPDIAAPAWCRPPPEECEENTYTVEPPGADPAKHRVKVRLVSRANSAELVEFALVQQTHDRGSWRDVVELDTCHDTDAHLHQYGRSCDARVRDPEALTYISNMDDVQKAYDLAYDRVFGRWAENEERWRHA